MNDELSYLQYVLDNLVNGNSEVIPELYVNLPNIAYTIINSNFTLKDTDIFIQHLLLISNILYNNTDLNRLPLDDSIYDTLFEYSINTNIDVPIGAPPIDLDVSKIRELMRNDSSTGLINPIMEIDKDNMIYVDTLFDDKHIITRSSNLINPIEFDKKEDVVYIERRVTDTAHMYPELVGTLRKSRAVLVSDVSEELLNDPTYRILERDFFGKHIQDGILDPDREITMVVELKYDGISIEADTSSIIHSARTRGDTSQGVASDMTPLLYGYTFPKMLNRRVADNDRIGVKFEAIITKENLMKYNEIRNTEYKNCRSAIVGLTSSSDGWKYREFISLVPLAMSGDFISSVPFDRFTEVQVLNELYVRDVPLHYIVVHGNYKHILFEIRKFLQEAQEVRDTMPFMYDGIVVTYVDDDIRQALGRKDFINQYQEAVKFEALKKSTVFLGYTYTVGQDGRITPMIHYKPVEFFGTIHDKSTGHSYQRVNDLQLRVGDIIDVEYVGDVMPYVTKSNIQNDNDNPILRFIEYCPVCNSKLDISKTGKTANCINRMCPGIAKARVVNMLSKLNIKDFGEARLDLLPINSFKDFMELTNDDIDKAFPTEGMGDKLRDRIMELNMRSIPDYQIVGSLGFKNIGSSIWKSIFEKYTLKDIVDNYKIDPEILKEMLFEVYGLRDTRINTIITEIPLFIDDLEYIINMNNIVNTMENTNSLKIRFSGIRDAEFTEYLLYKLHDAGEGSVTKDTDILIIPNSSYTSSKVTKAKQYNIKVMTIDEAKASL